MTLSHFDQIGSIRILTSLVWIRNEAWPIQVMQISPSRIFGNCGAAGPPERLTKREGIRTLVRKLRLCQSARGRSRTRVERFAVVPSPETWRMILRRLLFGKRIGTLARAYRLAPAKQNLLRFCFWESPADRARQLEDGSKLESAIFHVRRGL